ncbi:hypothetical protein PPERSA_02077 [Pseudocohnilembus persalinus]|uniref:Uncharacterized protein n=1 Tax=Pseudocohnilembus persalinus TaxID=266149 RepID=A0A0V0Q7U3_PSEPJ|nr:hypothetical protein PPERSA_02077 [Pseudocohnilembus persalinus]|eukprot:KRW98300.1 hypothetical protein PPERSA_02077 [Pseudocohnilembus persalinus]
MVQFDPKDFINLSIDINKQAIKNLGVQIQEFERKIHIQDFYDIKESKQMQIRRYLAKVTEIQQKLKAVMIERSRIQNEKGIINSNRKDFINSSRSFKRKVQSPFSKGYGSDGEGNNHQKMLQIYKDELKREIMQNVKNFINNEINNEKFQSSQNDNSQTVQNQSQQFILDKQNKARLKNKLHLQKVKKFKDEEQQILEQRYQINKKFKEDQLDFIKNNENIQSKKLKEQYERDQEFFQQRAMYQEQKDLKLICKLPKNCRNSFF